MDPTIMLDHEIIITILNNMPCVTGVDPITIRQSLIPSSLRPLSSQDEVEWKGG